MTRRLPAVLQVSAADVLGGAERIARQLHEAVRAQGGESWMAVGVVRSGTPGAFPIPNDAYRSAWTRAWARAAARWEAGHDRPSLAVRLARGLVGNPARWLAWRRGHEDFDYPATRALLELPPRRPELLHLHNLHPQYFDLRELPALSHRVPTVMTLHDQWLTTGHCGYSLDCGRWETGCGPCPYLDAYPPLFHDGTRFNWERKNALVAASRLHVAVPSEWLRGLVERSRVAATLRSLRLVRQGVDLTVFDEGDRGAARRRCGLPDALDVPVIMILADALRAHSWKGGPWVHDALVRIAATPVASRAVIVAVGDTAGLPASPAPVRYLGHISDAAALADCYRAADLFLHPSRADNYPNAIMESLACGTPVVATAVGGTPEQVCVTGDVTGALVPSGDVDALVAATTTMLALPSEARAAMRAAARADAERRFDARAMLDAYLGWYEELAATAAAERAS